MLEIVAPVYLCAGLGWLWVRTGRPYDTALMTDLVMLVGAPCLTFSSLTGGEVRGAVLLEMMGGVFLATTTMALIAATLLRVLGLPLGTYLAPLTFGNTGNMGIPICYFAFGPEGLALAICFYATTAFLQFTAGQCMWSGRVSFSELVRAPLIWASLLAGGVLAADVEVPRWILRTTTLMGDFTIPIMQFTLGVSLARLELRSLPRSLGLASVKLTMGASVGAAVGWLLGFEGVAFGVMVLDCAMPVAVFNYMFASRYDRSPSEVASVIVLSTLLAFVMLPILLSLVLE
jgi:predicted permease